MAQTALQKLKQLLKDVRARRESFPGHSLLTFNRTVWYRRRPIQVRGYLLSNCVWIKRYEDGLDVGCNARLVMDQQGRLYLLFRDGTRRFRLTSREAQPVLREILESVETKVKLGRALKTERSPAAA